MKKLVTAIVIASIGATFANSLVYDYKASIKRLDISMKTGKIDRTHSGILQKFSVKSDTIQGFVTLPYCEACDAKGIEFSASELGGEKDYLPAPFWPDEWTYKNKVGARLPENSYAYLTLKGDKFSKIIERPEYFFCYNADPAKKNTKVASTGRYLYILKSPVEARSAMFGADQAVKNAAVVNGKNNKNVWLALDFWMPRLFSLGADEYAETPTGATTKYSDKALQDVESVGRLIKNKNVSAEPNGKTLMYLGFLGLGNAGFGSNLADLAGNEIVPVKIQNAGFGTLKKDSTDPVFGICTDDVDAEECNIINSVSGTLVGYPYLKGICDHTPMWDFCTITQEVSESVISGTWSLKINKKMTANFQQNGEKAITDYFKVTDKYLYQVDEAGFIQDYLDATEPGKFIPILNADGTQQLDENGNPVYDWDEGGHLVYPNSTLAPKESRLFHELDGFDSTGKPVYEPLH